MKLKMAPNSGFAILLRSPWWVSFLVAGVFILVSYALLPREYAPFGAVGALPLMVIGCIAAWRQWHAPSASHIQATLEAASALPWRDLASALERAWQAEGQHVQALKPPQPGADWSLARSPDHAPSLLVSARRCKAANHGVEPLRSLHTAMQQLDTENGLYVVLQGQLTEAAQRFANDHRIAILEGSALATLLDKAGVVSKTVPKKA